MLPFYPSNLRRHHHALVIKFIPIRDSHIHHATDDATSSARTQIIFIHSRVVRRKKSRSPGIASARHGRSIRHRCVHAPGSQDWLIVYIPVINALQLARCAVKLQPKCRKEKKRVIFAARKVTKVEATIRS